MCSIEISVGGFAMLFYTILTLGAKIIMVNDHNYLLRRYYVPGTTLSTWHILSSIIFIKKFYYEGSKKLGNFLAFAELWRGRTKIQILEWCIPKLLPFHYATYLSVITEQVWSHLWQGTASTFNLASKIKVT